MERVEELMTKRKWAKHCLRTNCAAPEDCVMTGKIKVARSIRICYGNGRRSPSSTMPSKP